MVVDSMTKYEVMDELRTDFDLEVKPYYDNNLRKRIQPLIYSKAQRQKSIVSLGWEDYSTKKGNIFKILKRGDVNGDTPEFMAEFFWKNKKYHALFYQQKYVLVFHEHCLERYAERVLQNEKLKIGEVIKEIRKHLNSGFHIVLPTPTHPYSIYFVVANALFLGDYEDLEGKYKDKIYNWLNTCISLKEAHATQKGIMRSLSNMQEYTNSIGFNPIQDKAVYFQRQKELIDDGKEKLIEFFKNYYMLYQLFQLSNLPIEVYFKEEIKADMDFLKNELAGFSEHVEGLSPYGKKNGFAFKGEIDYRGHNKLDE
jgi:hypothetical protein